MTNRDYLVEIKPFNIRTGRVSPERCALIVIDMQKTFQQMAAPILQNVLQIIESCDRVGMKTIFTRYGYVPGSAEGRAMKIWWPHVTEKGNPWWPLLPEIENAIAAIRTEDSPKILDKESYSSFHHTDLEEFLCSHGVDQLIVTGVMTNCCCASTTRSAFDLGFETFVISDGNATTNDEMHIMQLKILAYGFSYVISTSQLLESLVGDGDDPDSDEEQIDAD